MLFNSYEFIFGFLPITLIFYLIFRRFGHGKVAVLWLVATSLFFYGWWSPSLLSLILVSIVVNYSLATIITSLSDLRKDRYAGKLLVLGIIFNLSLIAYFKYSNFFADSLSAVGINIPLGDITLPLAISFFTFQQIAYLVDARRGIAFEARFLQYCLFVLFFPQLIAGPIVHLREMIPQFDKSLMKRFQEKDIIIGTTIFCIGLFKKVIIADSLALVVSPAFTAAELGEPIGFQQAWGAAFAYSFQLYFDFSGYSDMAIGLARMFGIKLPINFNSPYKATNIIDFWRRWHMTLSRFLRDYLYIPLGGNRAGQGRRYTNLMITMLLGGLWHGAGWTFVIWGGLHGLYLLINHAWQRFTRRNRVQPWATPVSMMVTFFFVTMAWVFFRAESLDGALGMFSGMVNLPHTLAGSLGPLSDLLLGLGFRFEGPYVTERDLETAGWLLASLMFVWLLPNTMELMRRFKPAFDYPERQITPHSLPDPTATIAGRFGITAVMVRPNFRWGMFIGATFGAALMGLSRVSEFLYFQF